MSALTRSLLLATLGLAIPHIGAAEYDLRVEYEYELQRGPGEWVVVGTHFRHADDCTTYGCVLIGPMNDEDACKEWARFYNRRDPHDHVRCVSAENYQIDKY